MNKTLEKLTHEKFIAIYKDEKFRNEVAYAVQCCDANGKFKYFKTVSYPAEYIVDDVQIELAQKEIEAAKARKISEIESTPEKLVFVGMGTTYGSRYEGDICNHRIRTRFTNKEGHRFFIEVGTYATDKMRCDFSIDLELQYEHEIKLNDLYERRNAVKRYSTEWNKLTASIDHWSKQPYYNYGDLEGCTSLKYTFENLLSLINGTFDCEFTSIEVDNYNLDSDEFICKSPKSKVKELASN